MHLYIVRHGQTDYNLKSLYQGRKNIPLNETGRQQARMAADVYRSLEIHPDCIYTSPLDRAQETLEIMTGISREQFVVEPRIAEMSFGKLEGTYFDFSDKSRGSIFQPEFYQVPEGGETYEQAYERVASFLREIQFCQPGEQVLLASHATAIRLMMVYFGETDLNHIWDVKIKNCEIIEALLDPSSQKVIGRYETPGTEDTITKN